jgi:spore maturation protein CgeB
MNRESFKRLLVVGNPQPEQVSAHFLAAARHLSLEAEIVDCRQAWSRSLWVNRVFHHLLARRPPYLRQFSRKVLAACNDFKPEILLVTGITAPDHQTLQAIGRMNIQRMNYLTDDPWNPQMEAGFFWPALREYDVIWSPRRANLEDLRRHGCQRVEYLPFGYNPEAHFPETPQTAGERERFSCDVVFVGGADADRLTIAKALVCAGLKVHLYGNYWWRDKELRPHWRGFVYGREQRLAVGCARVNLCFGRKANRDGHAMRSLELPAMKACLVVEDTLEHRELYGADGDCVVYYHDLPGLVKQVQALCREPARARQLGENVRQRICVQGRHSYADRLQAILQYAVKA